MEPESRGSSPRVRRTSEMTLARLFSSTTTSGQSACRRKSFSSSVPRRSTSNSRASKARGKIATGFPPWLSWRRAGSRRRPENSYMTWASSLMRPVQEVSGLRQDFHHWIGHSGQHGSDTQRARFISGRQAVAHFHRPPASVSPSTCTKSSYRPSSCGPMLRELGPYPAGNAGVQPLARHVPVPARSCSAVLAAWRVAISPIASVASACWCGASCSTASLPSCPASRARCTELMFWRCITVAGACVEFVAAIAWLSELFPETKRREAMLGYAQVCATLGNFMIAGAWYAAVTWGDALPAVHGGHSPWRYALLFGALPAIPLMILRPFLPESRAVEREEGRGHFAPAAISRAVRAAPAARHAAHHPAGRLLLRAGLRHAAAHSRASCRDCRRWRCCRARQQEQWVSWVHVHVDTGALIGRLLLAGLVVWFVARRPMLRWLLVIGLGVFPFVFLGPALHDADSFKYAVLVVTMVVGRAVQLLGQLPAAGVSAAPARHRRELSP